MVRKVGDVSSSPRGVDACSSSLPSRSTKRPSSLSTTLRHKRATTQRSAFSRPTHHPPARASCDEPNKPLRRHSTTRRPHPPALTSPGARARAPPLSSARARQRPHVLHRSVRALTRWCVPRPALLSHREVALQAPRRHRAPPRGCSLTPRHGRFGRFSRVISGMRHAPWRRPIGLHTALRQETLSDPPPLSLPPPSLLPPPSHPPQPPPNRPHNLTNRRPRTCSSSLRRATPCSTCARSTRSARPRKRCRSRSGETAATNARAAKTRERQTGERRPSGERNARQPHACLLCLVPRIPGDGAL